MQKSPKMLVLSVALVASLAACGGGGGGGSVSPTPTAAPAAVRTVAVQRSLTSQALTTISSTQQLYQFQGGSAATASAVSRRLAASVVRTTAGWRAGMKAQAHRPRTTAAVAYSACSSGVESAFITVSPTDSQEYIRIFYDDACTQLWQDLFIDVVATSSNTATATGTDTAYTSAGAQYDYETIAMTIVVDGSGTGGQFSLEITDAATSTSAQREAIGVACILGTTKLSCGSGAVAHLASIPGDVGALLDEKLSFIASGGLITVPYSAKASGYASGLNTLALGAGSPFPAWAISGGTPVDTTTIDGQISFDASTGALAAGTITVTDSADDGTVTATASGSPTTIAGTVKQTSTGATVATFVVDAAGNGTVTYGDGSTAQIANWVLLG